VHLQDRSRGRFLDCLEAPCDVKKGIRLYGYLIATNLSIKSPSHHLPVKSMPVFTLNVNGKQHVVDTVPDMPLLWALRDFLRLTGTKYGCGVAVCGACTVHQDGIAVRSCQIPLSATLGKHYVTIEGLSVRGDHPCQEAWLEEDVSQCGYCQAGMIMQAVALLRRNPNPTDADIDADLAGHVCRCGTYQRMRRAIHRAASKASRT
jgi:isoquinoline 1-oxidoreductase alpha subunit